MTDILREIEKGHEAKYKLDEELHFKVRCRASKLFGLWAAEHLGYGEAQASDYARQLVSHCLDAPNAAAVVDNVGADLADAGVKLANADVLAAYSRCHAAAAEQFADAYPLPLDTDHSPVGG
ncbi:MAG: DUF1476 domain-containing protein [Rhodospirillales bacterium]|nr:DUF1476 domain-containing protein [Rhodospirillales bacterium]